MRDPDELIELSGISGDPRADQHFLVDDRVLDRIPQYAQEIEANFQHVLEIGAGTGALTDRLLQIASHVTAIERDRRLVEFLNREFRQDIQTSKLTVVGGDALAVDFPEFTTCIANLPFGISSEITFRLFQKEVPLILMYQREFAERMVATAGSRTYGRLSVSTRLFADPEIVEIVPKTAFSPQPAVDCAIVRLRPRTPEFEVLDPDFMLLFVKAVFTQRRKTLRNAIKNSSHISGLLNPEQILDHIDQDILDRRPEELNPEEFATLTNSMISHGEFG